MRKRFGDAARIEYVNIEDPACAQERLDLALQARDAGFLFPVTFIDGEVVYDGSVSYPAILRQVENRLGAAR
jgi:disulfide oxidoreductase YuzD